jgi:Xaa-Pro aminopeptidase
VRPGVKEYEIEAEFTHEFLLHGASGHAYSPIIASGKNACVLHYQSNDQLCRDGDLVLMDVGAEYGNYAADMTRTIPVNGKFSARQKQVYQAVLHVLKQATSLLRPGINNELWHKEVCLVMQEQLIKLGLISEYDVQIQHDSYPAFFKYYMHGSGHFIGLDVHDVGSRQLMFQPGMVITCEPGIYIAEENIGIRLENNILIDNQPINLMADIPIEPDEIEMLMQQKK